MITRPTESCELPTQWGKFSILAFEDAENDKVHLALTLGELDNSESVLARIHSECLTGDALFSQRCDCGSQLQEAMKQISEEGRGIILYLRQEGRGIGLLNKIRAYNLQDEGADTVEANESLGFGADMRDYSICGPMFENFGITKVRLMTNNPRKVSAMESLGIEVTERISIHTGQNPHNDHYLKTKAGKLGHMFD
ncbi:MAG: GTP cyclohydrolase II [Porticoccaceae bacterium]|nr:GTP cyclohydrolase II [Porticoccaceae bacterium]